MQKLIPSKSTYCYLEDLDLIPCSRQALLVFYFS